MKFRSIIKVAAAVIAACGLMLTSCDEVKTEVEVFEISIKNPSVASGKGQQFVNVKCDGDWTLALVAETGEVDWARLSATSGTGDKSNIILSYDVNAGEQDRSLKIYLDNGSKSVYCDFKQLGSGKHPEEDPDVKSPEIDGKTVKFHYYNPTAGSVKLAGDMTGWGDGPIDMTYDSATGYWNLEMNLAAGKHEYNNRQKQR